ncbi:MAG: type IV pilus assembly protein PilY1 [Halieaceae bacterium]|jgi:type IV pilus assembly protein PilY1
MDMNRILGNSKSRATLFAFLAGLWCAVPIWADDTEIFFGDIGGTDIRPNILFIIDTSGSMTASVEGTGKDRLDNVKDAMYQLLAELNNVNVGLMRFTNPGGPVLYPVTYIDKDVAAGSIVTVESAISDASDDAQEFESTGEMSLTGGELQIVELTSSTVLGFEDQVSNDRDDGEEWVNSGNNWEDSSDLDFDTGIRSGVRFQGSDLPSTGAIITNAFLRFTGYGGGNGIPLAMRIYGEKDDSGHFKNRSNYDLRDRADTNAYTDWTITDSVAADQTIDSPNIRTIVQEIVNDSAWASGEDDMVFIIEPAPSASGSGDRNFYTRDGSNSRAPQLFIEYYVGAAPTTEIAKTGLRFTGVDVPRGATLTEAFLSFSASRDFSTTHTLSIAAEDSGDASTFTSAAGNISGRTSGSVSVPWNSGDVPLEANSGDTFRSPDITSLVQDVTDRGDWCGGNNLALVISGTSGKIPVWAVEQSASLAPRLTVRYEYDSVVAGASCAQRTISRTINASSDDAEEVGSSVTTTSGDLDFTSGSVAGLRFRDIDIPRGTTISSARIELIADASDSGTTDMQIFAESSANAVAYTSTNGSIEGRGYFSTGKAWSETEAWSTNGVYRSPELKEMVTAVVAQTGWEPGNAMAFRINTSTNTDREAETYDGSPGEAPRLVIEYQDDGSGFGGDRRVRDIIAEEVSNLNHSGYTPIQDTLYEAALYYSGGKVKWGAARGQAGIDGGPFDYARVSIDQSMVPGTYNIVRPEGCLVSDLSDNNCVDEVITGIGTGPLYQSPIDNFCQEQSHIILLTDGFANRPHSESLIPTFMGSACLNTGTTNVTGTTTNLQSGERCVKDLAKYMNENDMATTLAGPQRVTTHTIGFNFSSQWLEDVATAGGGQYKTANNATQLVDEIKAIIGEVLKTDSTFVAPVAAVNEFNQLSHLSQVYFAVFRPDEYPRWRGNLKKYSLSSDGTANIVDVTGAPAVDPNTGFFTSNSRSFWSPTVDGDAVDVGGAASQTPVHASRNLYTYHSASTTNVLSASENAVDATNTDLTKAMFDAGTFSDVEFAELLNWIRGKDLDDENANGNVDETRYLLGDPLHSRPIAVTYGGTDANPDVEVFFGTNAGVIHSVNASNGQERFAFLPEVLMPMQKELRSNSANTAHPYGMDGTITRWSNDFGRDGISAADVRDFVRIYSGMRRGGRNYYGLDVSDRANPEMMWTIEGGSIQANGDDFTELGQSWSRPIKTQIVLSGDTVPREVLLFSGGYDEPQDDARLQTADTVGRAMYIVDALSGRIVWSGGKTGLTGIDEGFADMDYSFPSTMSVVDVNQDGLADMWYAGDAGGQIWRFDINNGESLGNLVSGGVIADVGVAGATNSVVSNRRFFSSPSVALISGPEGPELTIALGSGFRPSPLSLLATNQMFMIRQSAVFSAPATYTKLTASDLYNATTDVIGGDTGASDAQIAAARQLLYGKQGWYFTLPYTGEKVLSSPLIVNERIVFTTYTPGGVSGSCRPAAGTSRSYAVSLEDAVRDDPEVLLTPSIVDQATVIVPPPADPNEPDDPNDPDDPDDPNDPAGACPNGNSIEIKLNAEDGPIDEWCNDASKTYWMKER